MLPTLTLHQQHTDSNSIGGHHHDSMKMPFRADLKRPDLKGTFLCNICQKSFCHSSSLSRHRMQAHFKSFTCTVCNKRITSTDSLRAHMYKTHSVTQMFTCRSCSHAFADKISHDLHIASVHGGRADPDEQGDSTVDDNNNSVGDSESKAQQSPAHALMAQLNAVRQQHQAPNVPLCPPVNPSMPTSVFPMMLQQALQQQHQQPPTSNLHEILLKMRERVLYTQQSTPAYNAALAAMFANNPGLPQQQAAAIFPKLEPPQQTPLNLMSNAAAIATPADHFLTASDGDDELHSQSTSTTGGEPEHQRQSVVRHAVARSTPEAIATSTTQNDEVCVVKRETDHDEREDEDDDDRLSLVVDVEGDVNNNEGGVANHNEQKESNKRPASSLISALNVPYKKTKFTPPPSTLTSSPDSSTTMATLMRSMLAAKSSSMSPPTSSTHSSTNCGSCASLRSSIDQQIQRTKFIEENMHSELTRAKTMNATLMTTNGQLQRRLLACQQRIVQYIQQQQQHAFDPQAAHAFVEDILKSTLHT